MKGGGPGRAVRAVARLWRVWAGVIGLAVVVAWTSGACRARVAPATISREPGFALPADAAILAVETTALNPRIDVVGTVESEEKIHLSSRISTYVKEVNVSAGDRVRAGDVLVTLDDREIREQLAAAEAQFQQAETEYARAQRLFDTAAGTQQSLDAAESAFKAARAGLERVKVMLTYTSIDAPIDGIVTDRRIEAGDLASPGQVLLTVYDPENMRLSVPVPVRLVERLAIGNRVEVALERPAGTFAGVVTEIVGEINPSSRTQKVRIRLEDLDGSALPGTFGRVWVEEEAYDAVVIPAAAVLRVGQLEMVQRVEADRVVRRLVKTAPARGGSREVLSGLEPGDVILARAIPGTGS